MFLYFFAITGCSKCFMLTGIVLLSCNINFMEGYDSYKSTICKEGMNNKNQWWTWKPIKQIKESTRPYAITVYQD
jgi:hypothetical protein